MLKLLKLLKLLKMLKLLKLLVRKHCTHGTCSCTGASTRVSPHLTRAVGLYLSTMGEPTRENPEGATRRRQQQATREVGR